MAQPKTVPGRNAPIGAEADRHLITETHAANILGLKVATLRRWRWVGRGPQFIKVGEAVRYDPADIHQFIEAGRRRSTSDDPIAPKADGL